MLFQAELDFLRGGILKCENAPVYMNRCVSFIQRLRRGRYNSTKNINVSKDETIQNSGYGKEVR